MLPRPWILKRIMSDHASTFGGAQDYVDDPRNESVLVSVNGEAVLASYSRKRHDFTLEEIGLPAQAELFERAADRRGRPPPVVECQDVLADPKPLLALLCEACGVPFDPAMLSWAPGRRASDGVWAPAWYEAVEQSTRFDPPRREVGLADLPDVLKPIAERARPIYDRLAAYKLTAGRDQTTPGPHEFRARP